MWDRMAVPAIAPPPAIATNNRGSHAHVGRAKLVDNLPEREGETRVGHKTSKPTIWDRL